MTNPPQNATHPDEYGDPSVWNTTWQPPSTGLKVRRPRNWLSIGLVIASVLTLGVALLLGGELYARHHANSVVAKIAECEVNDRASVSFGARPLLLQAIAGRYPRISIETAGNQIRQAKGMKVELEIDDLHLQTTGSSRGTLGSLDAAITWSSSGIKQSLQEAIPMFGPLLSDVITDPSNGTIELQGSPGSITARPTLVQGGLALDIVNATGLVFTLPGRALQATLDAVTSSVTKNLPMGMHVDSVQVTTSGLTSRFSTRDATIPRGGDDPCLTGM
jgi:hypothetical protein